MESRRPSRIRLRTRSRTMMPQVYVAWMIASFTFGMMTLGVGLIFVLFLGVRVIEELTSESGSLEFLLSGIIIGLSLVCALVLFAGSGLLFALLIEEFGRAAAVSMYLAAPKCVWCDYSLRGVPIENGWTRCPECGKSSPRSERAFFRSGPARLRRFHLKRVRRFNLAARANPSLRMLLDAISSRRGNLAPFVVIYGTGVLLLSAYLMLPAWLRIKLAALCDGYAGAGVICFVLIVAALSFAGCILFPLWRAADLRLAARRQIRDRRCFWCRASLESVEPEGGYRRCSECKRLSPASIDIFTRPTRSK